MVPLLAEFLSCAPPCLESFSKAQFSDVCVLATQLAASHAGT
jgi:hypothetical protein